MDASILRVLISEKLHEIKEQWRIQDFPEEGAPTLQAGGGGAPTYNFAKFSQKLHEIERIWTPGGGASKILLCRSATEEIVLLEGNGAPSNRSATNR